MKANGGPQSWLAMKKPPTEKKRLKNPKKIRKKYSWIGIKEREKWRRRSERSWTWRNGIVKSGGRENHEVIIFLFFLLTGF